MPAPNTIERRPVGGVVVPAVTAQSQYVANAECSVQLSGAVSTAEVVALTQMIVTSTGATAAACVTVTISGLTTQQIGGNSVTYVFGVPAGAGVPAIPFAPSFDPPLMSKPGGAIRAVMGALGAGHVGASIILNGKIVPATGMS